jgi:nicotinamide-nucleotide amidase
MSPQSLPRAGVCRGAPSEARTRLAPRFRRTQSDRAARLWLLSGLVSLLSLAGLAEGAETNPAVPGGETNQLDYMLVVTGEELLRGVYPDAHACFITRTLVPLGCHCAGILTVDDRAGDINEALRFATNKARLVIVTGGLGPTMNDVTRTALAEFTGAKLHEHPEALAEMERRFKEPRDQLRPNLRRQTLVPAQGTYLKNPNGTAVGLVFESGHSVIVALPGPPRELQPMVTNELIPYLRRKFGVRTVGSSLTLRFVGIGQSAIDQALRDKVGIPPDVIVTSLFEGGRVDFTFSLPGATPADRAQLKDLEGRIRSHLGDYFYADDGVSLEELVVNSLLARGASLALVEVGSGGHLASAFDQASGFSRLLAGAWVAPTEGHMRDLLEIPGDSEAGPCELGGRGGAGWRQ